MILTEFYNSRKARLISMTSEEPLDKRRFLTTLELKCSPKTFSLIRAFAKEIEQQDISHGKLSKVQYMAHPYRVAHNLIEHNPSIDDSYIKLALCHNIIEVSGITEDLSLYLGPQMVKYVTMLTVDRELQWDSEYKRAYYKNISKEKITRTIKIFDKLDNLFILSENQNKKIKIMYLEEIENHLIPFVKLDTPDHEDYFKTLIKINYELINGLK